MIVCSMRWPCLLLAAVGTLVAQAADDAEACDAASGAAGKCNAGDAGDDSTVETVTFGVDVHSIEEVFMRDAPCFVRGFHEGLHAEIAAAWSEEELRTTFAKAKLGVRTSKGPDHSRIMRYSTRRKDAAKEGVSVFFDGHLNLTWPRHDYDAWEMEDSSFDAGVLRPDPSRSGSFSTGINAFRGAHDRGVEPAGRLERLACPFGCPDEIERQSLLWMASRGLGQQLHFDGFSNLFFHLHGAKAVVLAPPDAVVDTAHLHPEMHPASRQSALAWDAANPSRVAIGYSTPLGDDVDRKQPAYPRSRERVAQLSAGKVLYIPAYWGHQTFTAPDAGPSISLALWYYPVHRDPRGVDPSPGKARGNNARVLESAIMPLLQRAGSAGQAWAIMRALGISAIAALLDGDSNSKRMSSVGFAQHWEAQRWRPLYGGLGVNASAQVPAVLCETVREADAVEAAARKVAEHHRGIAEWNAPALHATVRRNEAGNILDSLVSWMPRLNLRLDLEAAGVSMPPEQLSLLIRSFYMCEAQQEEVL